VESYRSILGTHGPPGPLDSLAELVPLLFQGHRGFCIPKMSWCWFMLWDCYTFYFKMWPLRKSFLKKYKYCISKRGESQSGRGFNGHTTFLLIPPGFWLKVEPNWLNLVHKTLPGLGPAWFSCLSVPILHSRQVAGLHVIFFLQSTWYEGAPGIILYLSHGHSLNSYFTNLFSVLPISCWNKWARRSDNGSRFLSCRWRVSPLVEFVYQILLCLYL
jgi:hypothetical protein